MSSLPLKESISLSWDETRFFLSLIALDIKSIHEFCDKNKILILKEYIEDVFPEDLIYRVNVLVDPPQVFKQATNELKKQIHPLLKCESLVGFEVKNTHRGTYLKLTYDKSK